MNTTRNNLKSRVKGFPVLLILISALGSQLPVFGLQDPDFEALVRTGERTQRRLAKEPAQWTSIMELPNGALVHLTTTFGSDRECYKLEVEHQGKLHQLAKIIAKNDTWFVSSQLGNHKCRPYEAVVAPASIYQFLVRGELKLVSSHFLENCQFVERQGKTAIFQTGLSELQQAKIKKSMEMLRGTLKSSKDTDTEQITRQLKQLDGMLNEKISIKVNTELGSIEQEGMAGKRVWTRNFRWLKEEPAELFSTEGKNWEDHSDKFVVDDSVIQIAYDPIYSPGRKTNNLDLMFLNLETGKFRRVPFAWGTGLSGCFSQDRKKAYVTGMDREAELLHVFEIDSETGHYRVFGEGRLGNDHVLNPRISPDGKKLAVQQAITGTLQSQIFIIDIESGQETPVGKPIDTANLSWHPKGDRLILIQRKYKDQKQLPSTMICEMDLVGNLTDIVRGSHPVVLSSPDRILYRNDHDKLWYTCGLDGRNPRQIRDGMKGFGMPAAAPTGDKVIMIDFRNPQSSRPVLLDLETNELKTFDLPSGLWTMPVWK